MATTHSTDFFDDFKGHAQTLLAGSIAFSSVLPLVLKTINENIPYFESSIPAHVRMFYAVYVLYFVGPIILGLIAWWVVKKSSREDPVFMNDFLEGWNRKRSWCRWLRRGPLWVLGLLVVVGFFIMWPLAHFFHGPLFMMALGLVYLLLTGGLMYVGERFQRRFVNIPRSDAYRHGAVRSIRSQWRWGLLVSLVFFSGAFVSFFEGHEHQQAFSIYANSLDEELTIEMPFQWHQTAQLIDTVCVKPIKKSFDHVAEQANLLTATSLDYNDLVLRQMPDARFAWKAVPGLQQAANEVRSRFIAAYDTATVLADKVYIGSISLQKLFVSLYKNGTVDTLRQHYDLLKVRIHHPKTSDSTTADSLRLILANQLMPLADNLAEAAGSIQLLAENQSRTLLAEWVKITRFKGLFLLFCYLNILLSGWYVVRLAQEVQGRKAALASISTRSTRTKSVTEAPKSAKPYRELIYLKDFLLLTVLLILPLFRTVDEKTVSADQPFWFLNLPELLGHSAPPLPNGYSLQGNQMENHEQEVMKRLDRLDTDLKQLEKKAGKLEKSIVGTHEAVEELTHK